MKVKLFLSFPKSLVSDRCLYRTLFTSQESGTARSSLYSGLFGKLWLWGTVRAGFWIHTKKLDVSRAAIRLPCR